MMRELSDAAWVLDAALRGGIVAAILLTRESCRVGGIQNSICYHVLGYVMKVRLSSVATASLIPVPAAAGPPISLLAGEPTAASGLITATADTSIEVTAQK